MNVFKFQISNLRFQRATCRLPARFVAGGVVLLGIALFATEALARVGGGGSYGGGGGSPGGGGGAGGVLYLLGGFLLLFTIRDPGIRNPGRFIVIALVVHLVSQASEKSSS